MTKKELRAQLRELPALPEAESAERNRRLCEQVLALPAWPTARSIGIYAASAHEPDLHLLWDEKGDRSFFFPRVEGTGIAAERLEFYRVDRPEDLIASRWGLREPGGDSPPVDPHVLDLVLVPGVAFTATGQRLGRGRGHYDRFLPRLRPDAVIYGICFTERLLPVLPLEPHDVPLHGVLAG